jgi:hypothetical protein
MSFFSPQAAHKGEASSETEPEAPASASETKVDGGFDEADSPLSSDADSDDASAAGSASAGDLSDSASETDSAGGSAASQRLGSLSDSDRDRDEASAGSAADARHGRLPTTPAPRFQGARRMKGLFGKKDAGGGDAAGRPVRWGAPKFRGVATKMGKPEQWHRRSHHLLSHPERLPLDETTAAFGNVKPKCVRERPSTSARAVARLCVS